VFTLEDICNIAVQIERNGAEIYHNASKTAKNPKLAKTLSWMAGEEEKHAEWFGSIQSAIVLTPEQKKMENIGRSLLQDIVKSNTFSLDKSMLENTDELAEIISQSVEFERDTILFYEVLLGFLDNAETSKQLENIIQEEWNHIEKLKTMADGKEFHLCPSPF
jgi:rubrerythrin